MKRMIIIIRTRWHLGIFIILVAALTGCCASKCSNRKEDGFILKRVPRKEDLRQLWQQKLGKACISDHACVCEVHFDRYQWETRNDGLRSLKPTAVPSLFCQCSPKSARQPLHSAIGVANRIPHPLDDHAYSADVAKLPVISGRFQPLQQPIKKRRIDISEKENSCDAVGGVRGRPRKTSATVVHDTGCPLNSQNNTPPTLEQTNSVAGHGVEVVTPKQTVGVLADHEVEVETFPHSQTSTFESPTRRSFEPTKPNYPSYDKLVNMYEDLHRRNQNLKRENAQLKTRCDRFASRDRRTVLELNGRFGSDQLGAIRKGHARGVKWSSSTVRTALKVQFACGTTGYNVVSELQMPLPSIRTLQEKIKHIVFSPGILKEVVAVLPPKFGNIHGLHSEAMLNYDECAIVPARSYDPSTKSYIGNCTLPAAKPQITAELKKQFNGNMTALESFREGKSLEALNSKAHKAMVWLLKFIFLNCKQIVAYHFTAKSYDGEAVANVLKEIVVTLFEKAKVMVRVIVCDMGNRHVWRVLGIKVAEHALINSIPHFCNPNEQLYFSPDVVHVFKNFKECLIQNGELKLSQGICDRFGLPTNKVGLEDVITLINYQKDFTWKLAPKLKLQNVKSGHFNKMKVSGAFHTVNRRTAAALRFLATQPEGNPGMVTTAWLFELVFDWFKLMTSRSKLLALSKLNLGAYQEALATLRLTMEVFQGMKIKGGWKPVQSGVKMATQTVLNLCYFYIEEMSAEFFMTGKLTQCSNENTFSCIRSVRPNPTALHFKQQLRKLTCSQYWREVKSASYDFDKTGIDLVDLLNFGGISTEFRKFWEEEEKDNVNEPVNLNLQSFRLPEREKPAFYLMCGYVVWKVFMENSVDETCVRCRYDVGHHEEEPHRYGLLTRLSAYREGCLVEVADDVFVSLVEAEDRFRAVREDIGHLQEDVHGFVMKRMKGLVRPAVSDCHRIWDKILDRFVTARVKLFSETPGRVDGGSKSNAAMSSRSTGSRALADNFRPA